jgi:hypothetical protein
MWVYGVTIQYNVCKRKLLGIYKPIVYGVYINALCGISWNTSSFGGSDEGNMLELRQIMPLAHLEGI